MSTDPKDLEPRIQNLEAQLRLGRAADDVLEAAMQERLPLEQTLERMFALLLKELGADGALVRTYDEALTERDFTAGAPMPVDPDAIVEVTQQPQTYEYQQDGVHIIGQPIDVAGQLFGTAAVSFRKAVDPALIRTLLDTWCEQLDNYLASIAHMRHRHQVSLATSRALKDPVLNVGINQAIEVLRDNVSFEDMLLVFRHEDDRRGASLHYKIIQNRELTHDSTTPQDMDVDEFIRTNAKDMVTPESRALLDRFGIGKFREEILISGVRETHVLGRVIVTSARGEFNTFERDLVEKFADYLRQRIVDFNREWKQLSTCFAPNVVSRLLSEEGYQRRYLVPKDQDIAIMFCDISGFTRVSEQVLKEPALIGKLVDTWSERVVDILWNHGGVFDKMVGDCIIGLWGPPFCEDPPQQLCRQALQAAIEIRAFTQSLNNAQSIPELAKNPQPIGVSTGLNFAPSFVGTFGPNENFTSFSSGMNNTARLQGVAERDEILCMKGFVDRVDQSEGFGPPKFAKVKNVAEPLEYRLWTGYL